MITDTVEKVMGQFTKAVDRLENIAAKQQAIADRHSSKLAVAQTEAVAASNAATKIREAFGLS